MFPKRTRVGKGPFIRNRRFSLVLAVLFLVRLPANAEKKFPPYPVHSAREYTLSREESGIVVALDPLFEKETQKTFLGANLLSKGVLAVQVIVENSPARGSLMIRKDHIRYGLDDGVALERAGGPAIRSNTGAGVALAGAALISLPAMFVGLKMIANATVVQQHLLVCELRSQTVAEGKTASGFIFVPVGPGSATARKVGILIPLITGNDGTELNFAFRFDLPLGKE